jgi:hypothetical protein
MQLQSGDEPFSRCTTKVARTDRAGARWAWRGPGGSAMSDTQVTEEATSVHHQPWRDEPAAPRGAGRLYMTSELRAATGVSRTHMDFYLREGLVQPTARTESGYLLFDERELDTLRVVLQWRQDGLGLKEIRDRLGRS